MWNAAKEYVPRLALDNFLEEFQIYLEASWKLSGRFPEAEPSWRGPGPRSALALVILPVFRTLERRTLARAAETRFARGARLFRLDAKFNHALGEHRKKHHVLWFRPDGDDSVRGARLSVFGRGKAFSD